ncbi:MAG: hypothetical protein Q9157_000316 [Trypethelium eluteriae]
MPPLTIARNIEPGMEKPKFQPNLTGKALPSERKIGVFRRILDEALTADLPLPNPDDTVNSFLFALAYLFDAVKAFMAVVGYTRLNGLLDGRRLELWATIFDGNPAIISELMHAPIKDYTIVVGIWYAPDTDVLTKPKAWLKLKFTNAAEWTWRYRVNINPIHEKIYGTAFLSSGDCYHLNPQRAYWVYTTFLTYLCIEYSLAILQSVLK